MNLQEISNKIKSKSRLWILAIIIFFSSIFGVAYVDNYFDIAKNLDIFSTLYKELNIQYVDDTDPGKLMKTAIDAMLKSLDPYTVYYPESDIEDYRFMTTGQYGGIGTLIRKKDEFIEITEPYEGYPAEKAGLLAGDLILAIDGKSIEGKSTNEVSKFLKGQAGTKLVLQVKRAEKTFDVELSREEIKVKDVPYYGNIEDDIGYIKLNSFTSSASKELIAALKELKSENELKGVIVDLRGNGGGLLNEAVNIVNAFVDRGQSVVEVKGKLKDFNRTHKALNAPVDLEIPIAIIIDGGSASASEIVSGAIQDLDRGVVIGEKSFGKGLVQQTKPLSYNSTLKVTVAKYYIPSGRCIQKLDYSHKNERGLATEVPDSLMTIFYTKNGREVKDGGGIYPDIEIEPKELSNIAQSLYVKNHIFDFATLYKTSHDSITNARDFSLTANEYQDFIAFLDGKDYDYTTQSEKLLKEWEKVATNERYFTDLKEEFESFKAKVKHNKENDLNTFKDEIIELLENEIVSRYYYQSGRLENNLKNDANIKKAIEVLRNQEEYQKILSGKAGVNASKK